MSAALTTIRHTFLVAVIVVASFFAAAAPAQPAASARPQRLVASGDPTVDAHANSGHGWAFLPVPTPRDTSVSTGAPNKPVSSGYLLHLVPRQSVHRASAGSVRLAMSLTRAPLAIASWEGTAILLQGPADDDGLAPAERTVSTLTASGPLTPGTWGYQPVDRLQLRAALPGDVIPRSIVGATTPGSRRGPVLTWERVSPEGGTLEIALLDDSAAWCTLQPPLGFPTAAGGGEVHALAVPSGVVVAVRSAGDEAFTLWHTSPDVSPPAPPKTPGSSRSVITRWTSLGTAAIPQSLQATPIRTIGPAASCWLWRDAGQTLLAARGTDNTVALWRLGRTRAVELWRSSPLPLNTGALVAGGLDAVTVLVYDPPELTAAQRSTGATVPIPEAGRLRAIDVSHLTGAVLADLPAHTDGFFTRAELAILVALFLLIGMVILTVVLRTDGPQEVQLPEGTALASPVRRVLGGAIDVAVAVALTSALIGGTPAQWLAPTTSTSSSLAPLLGVFGIGCVLCTIGEAVIGCSPGKLLVGVRVLGLVPVSTAVPAPSRQAPTVWTAARPRLRQAFLRNAVRWFMPPMGVFMLLDNNWRHPGDILARTVVVVRFNPEDEPPPGNPSDEGNDQ